MIILQVILLDGRPVLPPGELSILIFIETAESTVKVVLGNISVRIVSLEHRIVLLVPLCVCHDTVVLDFVVQIRPVALGVVPEGKDEPVVVIILVLLPFLDNAIVIGVAEAELISRIHLIADAVVDNVVKRIHDWQDCLEVFLRVSIGSASLISVGGRLGSASQVVEKLIFDFFKGWFAIFHVNRVVLDSIVLKELDKADFSVAIEVDQLIFSSFFSSVATAFADIIGQGLELFLGYLTVRSTCVQVGKVELS